MRGSTIVRVGMILVFIAMVVAVSMLWRDRPDEVAVDPDPPEVDPDVVSRTLDILHVAESNGVRNYEVRAGRMISYEGNRQEYDQGVELKLYSVPDGEEGAQDVTVVTAERMELRERDVPIEGDRYERVRLFENVQAVLPNGAQFAGDEITYRDGELSTNEGVRLRAGGIVVESRVLRYDPDASIAELAGRHRDTVRPMLRGPVKLWSESEDGGAPAFELDGSARRLIYDVRPSLLRLFGAPRVGAGEARVWGSEVLIGLDQAATTIESIEARGNANAVWLPPETVGEYNASAEIIAIDLGGGEPSGMVARTESEDLPRPAFMVDGGEVRADLIELAFGDPEEATVDATGQAFFLPDADDTGLTSISADSLSLGGAGFEQLAADGNVEIELKGPDSAEVSFAGPRALFEYRDDAVASAEWPAGLRYRDETGDTTITAGHGALEAESGDWLLREIAADPAPDAVASRPSMSSPEVDVVADEIDLRAGGDVDLRGAVQASLSGDAVRTVGALLGDAPEVEAAADAMHLSADGGRLDFVGNARVWQPDGGDRILRADEIELRPDSDELEAQGNVFVNLVDAADPDAGRDEPRTILLSGNRLLVEERLSQLVVAVAGDALLELEGRDRVIGGGRLSVELTDEGNWQTLEVFDNVVMTDPAGRGEGGRLEYNADTGEVIIYAAEGGQATFINDQDIDIRDREGLRLEWQGEVLTVTAMQNGTTQTVRGGQR